MKEKNSLRICLIIGLCFLFTSSGYLNWLNHLLDFFTPTKANVLSEVAGYFFQVSGLALYLFLRKRNAEIINKKYSFICACAIDFLFISVASLHPYAPVVTLVGLLMNIFHGIVAGFYLNMLLDAGSHGRRAGIFGFGYAIGTIGSWLISLLSNNHGISKAWFLVLYGLIVLLVGILAQGITPALHAEENSGIAPAFSSTNSSTSDKCIVLAVICVLLISLVNSLGFCLPLSVFKETHITLEFTRLFYTIGLILAGIINNKSRKFGGIACICALFFPFIELILKGNSDLTIFFWCIGYVFFGFIAVYRIVLFLDFAEYRTSLFYLAPAGLMIGRIGDATGALIGTVLQSGTIALCTITAVLFAFSIITFFLFYERMYFSGNAPKTETPDVSVSFTARYDLSPREQEVLKLILNSKTNKEIGELLFVSENTIKFHVKNILKKTGCTSRKELIQKAGE